MRAERPARGLREYYADIELTDKVDVIEHLTPQNQGSSTSSALTQSVGGPYGLSTAEIRYFATSAPRRSGIGSGSPLSSPEARKAMSNSSVSQRS